MSLVHVSLRKADQPVRDNLDLIVLVKHRCYSILCLQTVHMSHGPRVIVLIPAASDVLPLRLLRPFRLMCVCVPQRAIAARNAELAEHEQLVHEVKHWAADVSTSMLQHLEKMGK